jgi:hypothetical protein
MRRQTAWTLLYQDSLAQVWGRSETFNDPESPQYVSPEERVIGDDVQQGLVAWPALPRFPTRARDPLVTPSPEEEPQDS